MSGIIFLKTNNLQKMKDFYVSQIGMKVWQDQNDCIILKHGNLLLGFCNRIEIDNSGMITFFYPTKEEVDSKYEQFKHIATSVPVINDKYSIYQFFAEDPEGRALEFQYFINPTLPYLACDELLMNRRSIRKFKNKKIDKVTLNNIFELCRYAPTSKNSQSYYFIVIQDLNKLKYLASLRGAPSAPIAKAPLAVAIVTNTSKTLRPEQDGCIAAYHFILSAWQHGLGTCWIAAMDRDDLKEALEIPKEHYVATVTPLGYPAVSIPKIPQRRESSEFVRTIEK